MTRPASHRKQEVQPRCSNCCYSAYPEMSRRLFCVKDDVVVKNRDTQRPRHETGYGF